MVKIAKRKIIISIICIVIVFVAIVVVLYPQTYPNKIILGGKLFYVEVADTKMLLTKGLSGHLPLDYDEGMFFVFQNLDKHGFWMKDMLFGIDIIWFDQNYRIIDIKKSAFPSTYPEVFYPKAPAMYVLEVTSGVSDDLNLKTGDTLQFIKK